MARASPQRSCRLVADSHAPTDPRERCLPAVRQAGLLSQLQARRQAERVDPAQTIDALTRVDIACRYLGHGKSWYDTGQRLFAANGISEGAGGAERLFPPRHCHQVPASLPKWCTIGAFVLGGHPPKRVSRHRQSSATGARGSPGQRGEACTGLLSPPQSIRAQPPVTGSQRLLLRPKP